ncbi:MAG: Ribosome maturation factor RimP [Pelotomaculum sp. PtaB.Bin013]|uniref:Ribosome maturation factor RimP n=1 Tax=Pelotomaculum isophthalicicum JI TaxID=947010 RepID=A0A9X4GXZ7_9FIRM|nr:ribosome maturation factor RimP [Pelotomaculum isophthalicicum]MDF9407282.1 ribosome maturation factor RimP [Pelotomaculum isophthalicicum JI]OPX91954.1 MAG: Ribosome maturation factor RimP [Pelotomaculum sp. PtaB.Bin013]
MASHQVVKLVQQIALPIVQEAGIELVDVEFLKEGGRWYLRIFIDKPDGISHEDCRFVSERIDRLLDEKVPISHSYSLEVSSPGIERPIKKLEDYSRFKERSAVVTTFVPINGRKKFSGRLMGTRMGNVVIDIDGTELCIPLEQIASARLAGEL